MRRSTPVFLCLALCLVLSLVVACDSPDNPTAPAGSFLSITASPTQIPLTGSSSTVTVSGFKPDGKPMNPGTLIRLTTDRGVLRPAGASCSSTATVTEITVDDLGRALAQLCGDGRQGAATVSARLTTSAEGEVTVTVQIGEDVDSKPTLIMSANPSIVPVGGTSQITFLGRNADGSPTGNGQRVRLTADFGKLCCQSDGSCTETTSACAEVFTDANGEANATFLAGDRATTMAPITGILGAGDPVTISLQINDAPADFSFQAAPSLVNVGAGDAVINLSVQVLNSQGTSISGVSVIFGATIGGTFASGNGVRTTDAAGEATDTLTVPQGNLTANQPFFVTARVIGEGIELPEQSRMITVDP